MQEWQLIENTAMTENQRFKTAEIYMVYFTNITHKPSYNLKHSILLIPIGNFNTDIA
jgi:hypothetical protein